MFLFLRRYRLKAEYKAQEEWPMKWGYLMTSMEKVIEKFIRNHLSPGSTQSCQEINGHHLIISKNELKEGG